LFYPLTLPLFMPFRVLPNGEGFCFLEFTMSELQNNLADIMQPQLYKHISSFIPDSFATVWLTVLCCIEISILPAFSPSLKMHPACTIHGNIPSG